MPRQWQALNCAPASSSSTVTPPKVYLFPPRLVCLPASSMMLVNKKLHHQYRNDYFLSRKLTQLRAAGGEAGEADIRSRVVARCQGRDPLQDLQAARGRRVVSRVWATLRAEKITVGRGQGASFSAPPPFFPSLCVFLSPSLSLSLPHTLPSPPLPFEASFPLPLYLPSFSVSLFPFCLHLSLPPAPLPRTRLLLTPIPTPTMTSIEPRDSRLPRPLSRPDREHLGAHTPPP